MYQDSGQKLNRQSPKTGAAISAPALVSLPINRHCVFGRNRVAAHPGKYTAPRVERKGNYANVCWSAKGRAARLPVRVLTRTDLH